MLTTSICLEMDIITERHLLVPYTHEYHLPVP